ncbi:MAG TPA: YifB family Mg chelatase-like AAA ATPase [Syntrophomonadaceae bacterium]|nr:YifB family Mg chelatase-like AAA ATPase [Syntrophomonadaceae bacterium]HNX28574.1 YifB family Mg chelatase-like AAA ATPase [Syntrophomonadaceae bacterium]HPR92647.1 YifB family Mg chelatase-like AAA ATPase [Syntrophomonadaceae bacterium]
MLAVLNTLFINGIEARPVKVEVDIQNGLPDFQIVGLASIAIKEARERVRSAIKNCNYKFPNQKIIVNLAPADLKKEGTHFDLAIALGILIASEQVRPAGEQLYYLAGELSLDGIVRKVPGILPMALELINLSYPVQFIIPEENSPEAALVNELAALPVNHLNQVIKWLEGEISLESVKADKQTNTVKFAQGDFAEVKGQDTAKRALQIAAAGMHNILLIGPPGGGKTMLARRVVSIFPDMTRQEVLESTRIYSVANLLNTDQPLINSRPFRSPHKNASSASIVGGGRIPRPGEISLAQNGVLFLDELPEFNRDVLEALRQPLEDKVITVARAHGAYTFPANFILIASMNPCPCGNFGSQLECRCTPLQIHKYLSRISGPLLDRMDLHVEVPRVRFEQLKNRDQGETSAQIKERVALARTVQEKRFADQHNKVNALMTPGEVKRHCILDKETEQLLKSAFNKLNLSARGYDRILKVARTIADLDDETAIKIRHIAEALQYRSLDKKYWMA